VSRPGCASVLAANNAVRVEGSIGAYAHMRPSNTAGKCIDSLCFSDVVDVASYGCGLTLLLAAVPDVPGLKGTRGA
jgi:hypothetical protein